MSNKESDVQGWRKVVHRQGADIVVGGEAFDYRLVIIVIWSVLGPMIYWYNPTWQSLVPGLAARFPYALGHDAVEMAHMQFMLFFVVPMAIILIALQENPIRDYGFTIGNWREGLIWTAAGTIPIIVAIWVAMRFDEDLATLYRQVYYPHAGRDIEWADHARMAYAASVQLFAWEYLLRGFLLFGAARFIGVGPAILLQMIPFALLHLSKPEIEAVSTIFTGILFGIIAWRTRTFLYVFLIHVIILVTACLIAVA